MPVNRCSRSGKWARAVTVCGVSCLFRAGSVVFDIELVTRTPPIPQLAVSVESITFGACEGAVLLGSAL